MNIRRWIAATMLLAAALRADTIVVADREYPDVRVRELRDGTLWYEQNGRGGSMPADRIRRLAISDEPAFTAAESARAAGRWDAAIDSYQTALRSSNKPWLRLWSAARLVESANQSGRFDAGVAAWLMLVGDDPAEARRLMPTVPAGKSGFLAPAAEQLEKALAAEQRARHAHFCSAASADQAAYPTACAKL